MKKLTFVLGSLILMVMPLFSGCAGENTYAVDYDGQSDFLIAVFNGDAETIGNGQGQTPNSANNPFTGPPGANLTILVTGIGSFDAPVHLTTHDATGGITVTQPTPNDQNVTKDGFKASEFTYSYTTGSKPKSVVGTRTVIVTATSGTKSHSYTVHFNDDGDFTITVYNGDAATIGDGTGFTPNGQANQFPGMPGEKLTVVVKPINGFAGTVHLTAGQETGGVTVTGLNPVDQTVSLQQSKDSEFTYTLGGGGGARPFNRALGALAGRTAVITGTSGSKVHTYTVFFEDNGDFTITVYNGDAAMIGDGTGFTPNGPSNQFGGAPGEKMTVVIKTVGSFLGTVHLTAGQETGGIVLTQPDPSDQSLVAVEFKDSEFSWDFGGTHRKSGTRGIIGGMTGVITATSGTLVHTYTVFINFD